MALLRGAESQMQLLTEHGALAVRCTEQAVAGLTRHSSKGGRRRRSYDVAI